MRLFMPAELHEYLCQGERGCGTRGRNDFLKAERRHGSTSIYRACGAKTCDSARTGMS